METIWKFSINLINGEFHKILMPRRAKILTVAKDPSGKFYVWALVNPNRSKSIRVFRVIGTGFKIEEPTDMWNFIGTIVDGMFVCHIFVFAYEGDENVQNLPKNPNS